MYIRRVPMAKDASFDIVSEVNTEEVKNAIQQTTKELSNRFDFKDSTVEIKLENSNLVVLSDDDFKIEQIKDVLFGKLIKRNVPIKNIHFSESEHALGGKARQTADLVNGIDRENAKKILLLLITKNAVFLLPIPQHFVLLLLFANVVGINVDKKN